MSRLTFIAKKIINRFPQYSKETLIQKIAGCPYVSFDIFDTLVKRTVASPQDVFRIVAKRFPRTAGGEFHDSGFIQDRVTAERAARIQASRTGKEEVSLEDIYKLLPECYTGIRQQLLNAELQIEKDCCHANPVIRKVFHWCKKHGKRIILISDMYLPQDAVEDILFRCGYFGYEKLYLSSAVGKTKHTGALYDHALSDLAISPEQLVHVGDGLREDWLNARKRHIKAIRIARNPKRTKFTRLYKMPAKARRQFAPVAAVMSGLIDPKWSECYQFGFECLGPILYGFCNWLHQNVKKKGLEHIFFFSRDGYLMQKGYRLLFGEEAVPNSYLYVSRRALYTPQIWIHPEYEDIMALYGRNSTSWSSDSFCEKLGIDPASGRVAWANCGLGDKIYFHEKNPKLSQFYEKVKETAVLNSKKDFALVTEYLAQQGLTGNVAIVDIGWSGSMQVCLQEIVSHSTLQTTMYGYYVGLKQTAFITSNADAYIPVELRPDIGLGGIWELLFCAQHGSVKSYMETEQGRVAPVLYDPEPRSQKEREKIEQIQQGALYFLGIAKKGLDGYSLNGRTATQNLLIAARMPRNIEVSLLADSLFFETNVVPLAKPKKIAEYVIYPAEFKQDFANSCWKVGFMKRLFRLPLPYWQIYKILRAWIKKG